MTINPDIVHTHGSKTASIISSINKGLFKHVATVHGVKKNKIVYESADYVIGVSDHVLDGIKTKSVTWPITPPLIVMSFDFSNPSINTIFGYKVGYEVNAGVSLICDFRQFYRDTGNGLEPIKQTTIETAFNF